MEYDKSCGCVIIEDGKVLLIKQNKGHWGFPKGHPEADETEIQTAIREVKEETNVDVKISNKKEYIETYDTDKGIHRKIIYFIAEKVGGELKPQESEINIVKWFDFEEALKIITYKETREILERILKDI